MKLTLTETERTWLKEILNENEPIVNSPSDAIDMFLRTDIDYLIVNNYIISKF